VTEDTVRQFTRRVPARAPVDVHETHIPMGLETLTLSALYAAVTEAQEARIPPRAKVWVEYAPSGPELRASWETPVED
jgi:hypothetical protein